MAGIQETKEVMLFGISLAMAVDETTKDGFQWTDLIKMVPPFTKLPEAIIGIENVPAELDDLDDNERMELVEEIKKLEFSDENSEEIAEQALRTGVEFGKLMVKIRQVRE